MKTWEVLFLGFSLLFVSGCTEEENAENQNEPSEIESLLEEKKQLEIQLEETLEELENTKLEKEELEKAVASQSEENADEEALPEEEPVPSSSESVREEENNIGDNVTFGNVISTISDSDAEAEIKVQAEKDWEDNNAMQEYVMDEQLEAFNYLKEIELTSESEHKLMEKAFDDWGYNFRMVKYIIDNEIESDEN
jgi:hypothetical protein